MVMALPLGFSGKLRILRTTFLLGTLHAVEASGISFTLLQRLRSAFVSAVWSKKMPLPMLVRCSPYLMGPQVVIRVFLHSLV